MNLSDEATSYMTRLMPGHALAFAEGLQRPVIVRIDPRTIPATGLPDPPPYRAIEIPITPPWVDRLLDRPLEIAFQKLFSSMWRTETDADLFIDNLEEFGYACDRTAIQQKDAQSWWRALTEREVERRGALYQWPFEKVESAIHLANEVFDNTRDAISTFYQREPVPSDEELLKTVAAELQRFADYWSALSDLGDAHRPFPGCDSCVEACHYRFDMQAPVQDELEGKAEYQDHAAEILEFALEAASERFSKEDLESTQRAALCWGVQQLGKGAVAILPGSVQREWAEQLNQDLFAALNDDAGEQQGLELLFDI